MGSGPGQGFSEESLKAISAPFVVDTAELDEILDPRSNSGALATLISGAREIRRSAGHFAYVPECRSIIGPILARVAGIPICNDPDGVDRAAVHQHVARDVIQFFNTELRVDD
jgi:predicted dienelactone hydrolase